SKAEISRVQHEQDRKNASDHAAAAKQSTDDLASEVKRITERHEGQDEVVRKGMR
ncbi:hypothetical protein V494_06053, partial [Pseudogymnoascus sp. VKM F-4513 (FW-928)]